MTWEKLGMRVFIGENKYIYIDWLDFSKSIEKLKRKDGVIFTDMPRSINVKHNIIKNVAWNNFLYTKNRYNEQIAHDLFDIIYDGNYVMVHILCRTGYGKENERTVVSEKGKLILVLNTEEFDICTLHQELSILKDRRRMDFEYIDFNGVHMLYEDGLIRIVAHTNKNVKENKENDEF